MNFRIGATVLLLDEKNSLQSYGFEHQRLLGSIEEVLKFLEKYQVDEIHCIFPIKGDPICSLKAFMALSKIPISTPISIGGGISSKNISQILQNPFFERLIFNRSLFNNDGAIEKASSLMGRQAMVGSLPFVIVNNILKLYNSSLNKFEEVTDKFWKKLDTILNEIILLDARAEGNKQGFDFSALKFIDFPLSRVIISGGIIDADIKQAKKLGLAGVSIDNSVLHKEYSIKELR